MKEQSVSEKSETKFNLSMPVQYLKGVGPARAEVFAQLGVKTVADLLEYFPRDWQFAAEVVKVVVNDQVAVFIELVGAVAVFEIDIIAGSVLAAIFADSKEDGVIFFFRAEFLIPFLHKQNTSLGASMRFEGILMQADDSQYPCTFFNEFPDPLVGGIIIIESALRQDDGVRLPRPARCG